MPLSIKDTWKVATTFIGTIVGAGFASGQEILKFFGHFGPPGILGILLSCIIFCAGGTLIMVLGHQLRASSFGDVVIYVCGSRLGRVVDLVLGVFLFGSLSVMLAGSGAVLCQQWGLPYWLGTLFTLIISLAVVLSGIRGIISANSVVVPLMITICLLAIVPAISGDRLLAICSDFRPVSAGASSLWYVSALLYAAYNLTLGVSVLAPLGNEIKDRRSLVFGGVFGGLGLGGLAMLINLAILSHYPASAGYEIPSLFVAGSMTAVIQAVFSFVLWAEIFTTIIGTIYGLAARITANTRFGYLSVTIVLLLGALVLSQFGFSGLVGTLYPLFGYVSLVFLICLFSYPLIKKS
ncbi:YkvI family membrane protein [Phosphitispora fastidiosa]|uniref:YkvI family membrane protein n=1 Tax=Phosphitispora fastidiosa TaxID=2837202 RepID=UPI001E41767C|nr:hypothetical protein [Phosphitispora fastidiosa]MBU7005552.1 putative membrane protein YkvI [Phosphitispora fastidiosa]